MASYSELKAQAEKILAQAEEVRKAEIAQVINDIKAKIAQYGISPKDLGFSGGKSKKGGEGGSSSPAKYRNKDGGTWTGMGRKPHWLKDALESGRKLEDFLI